ncbi:hypothetical protein JCM24511_06149 [Saitozyma sp. JCM 24511]|nr:hypothetical protein JCM24511_06149 [Saitozyma sp. JCM 24511]
MEGFTHSPVRSLRGGTTTKVKQKKDDVTGTPSRLRVFAQPGGKAYGMSAASIRFRLRVNYFFATESPQRLTLIRDKKRALGDDPFALSAGQ